MDIIDGIYLNAGTQDLYIKVIGEGEPAIVIEPAIAGLSVEWYVIQKELSRYTTVVTYDRAGYAESKSSKVPRASETIANELFNLMFNSNIEHPYILIGHLEGGLFAQHFAKLFKHYVAGLILVDSLFPNYFFQIESEDFPKYYEIASYRTRINNIRKLLEIEDEEFPKRVLPLLEELYRDLPDEYRIPILSYQSEKKFFKTTISEMEMLFDSYKETGLLGDEPLDIPLFVISHDPDVMQELSVQLRIPQEEARKIERFWLEEQKKLLGLSRKSNFYIAKGADRNIHYSNPQIIISLALEMLERVRKEN